MAVPRVPIRGSYLIRFADVYLQIAYLPAPALYLSRVGRGAELVHPSNETRIFNVRIMMGAEISERKKYSARVPRNTPITTRERVPDEKTNGTQP